MAEQEKPECFKRLMGVDSQVCDDLQCTDDKCPFYWVAVRERVNFVDPSINQGAMDGGKPRY